MGGGGGGVRPPNVPTEEKKVMYNARASASEICIFRSQNASAYIYNQCTSEELSTAIGQLKSGKAQGPDNIPPELLLHCGQRHGK